MQTVQGTSSAKIVTSHAMFLANVSRHFVSLEIEPMLEAVGRSALCVLGDICAVDRVLGATPTRILEVRATQDAWMEAPSDLADTVPLGYGQLTSPLDQIASVAGGRAGTNFHHIPDGTVSIR